MCEVIRAWTRIGLGNATGRSGSEKHYRKRTGSHDGLDKGVNAHHPKVGSLEAWESSCRQPHHTSKPRRNPQETPPLNLHPEATARPRQRELGDHKHNSRIRFPNHLRAA